MMHCPLHPSARVTRAGRCRDCYHVEWKRRQRAGLKVKALGPDPHADCGLLSVCTCGDPVLDGLECTRCHRPFPSQLDESVQAAAYRERDRHRGLECSHGDS